MSPDLDTSWLDAMERVKGLNFRQKSCTDPWSSHCGSLDLNNIFSIYNYLEHLECAHMHKTYLYVCIYSKQIQKTSQRLGFSLIAMQSEPDRFFLTHKQQWRGWQIETLNRSHTKHNTQHLRSLLLGLLRKVWIWDSISNIHCSILKFSCH